MKTEPVGEHSDTVPVGPRDAATVILVRDADPGPEVFMVRRHEKSPFMGGAHVFPGGKLDAADCGLAILAMTQGRSPREAALALGEAIDQERAVGLFVAAIRETFEEAGVLLGEVAKPSALLAARDALDGGRDFGQVLTDVSATLRLDWLVPWTRWITPEIESRRYDARFFLARCPEDQKAVRDEAETTDAAWLRPGQALAKAEAGAIMLPPPTLRSLELLSDSPDVVSMLERAATRPPPVVAPEFIGDGEAPMLVLPGDPRHSNPTPAIEGPSRFLLSNGRWLSADPS